MRYGLCFSEALIYRAVSTDVWMKAKITKGQRNITKGQHNNATNAVTKLELNIALIRSQKVEEH